MVLATVGSSTKSELEFWDLDFSSEERREGQTTDWGTSIQQLGSADHYGVTDVEWDPSGRYLATSASAWRHTVRFAMNDRRCIVDRKIARKWICDLGLSWARA